MPKGFNRFIDCFSMEFYKFDGAGNDFVIVDNRKTMRTFSQAELERLCHRRFGVGADGFMTLERMGAPDFPVRPKVIVLTGLARETTL